jgi:hypothetical protein
MELAMQCFSFTQSSSGDTFSSITIEYWLNIAVEAVCNLVYSPLWEIHVHACIALCLVLEARGHISLKMGIIFVW